MGKKKIFVILVVLFLCFLSLVMTVGAALLFRQNQLNQSEIKTLKDQIETLKQDREEDAKGGSSSSSGGTTPSAPSATPPSTIPATDYDTGATFIYLSKTPESFDTDFSFTVAVSREINVLEPVETAMREIIIGPTTSEYSLGYRNPVILTGGSNCGGDDFTVSTTYDSTARTTDTVVQFCKDLPSGIGPQARIKSVITDTLSNFGDSLGFHLGDLNILTKEGNCIGDESGMNICLH
ncbi:MAG: hypothetical protein ABIM99_04480 [Candidatus Dojkabacteria bacterium]